MSLYLPHSAPPSFDSGYADSAAVSAYPGLWESLEGLWVPGLGATGLQLFDVSGNYNHGALTNMNGSDWVASEMGEVLDFEESSSQSVEIDNADMAVTFPYSIAAWVRIESSVAKKAIICSDDWGFSGSNYNGAYLLIQETDYINIGYGDNTGALTPDRRAFVSNQTQLTVGRWHHVAGAVWDVDNASIWLDGAEQTWGATGTGTDIVHTAFPGGIGRQSSSTHFDGLIAQVGLWDRALAPQEIQQLYLDPLAPLRQAPRYYPVGAAPPAGNAPTGTLYGSLCGPLAGVI